MNYLTRLRKTADLNNSIVSIGLDPVPEKIPVKGKPDISFVRFFSDIISAMSAEKHMPGAAKINYAMYAAHGFPGLRAMKRVIALCRKAGLPVILDAKRADFGIASECYARELFDFWQCDAATIVPFFGRKAVQPFLDYCDSGKGVYVINRVLHHDDLQNIEHEGIHMYLRVSHRIVDWYKPGLGSVVAADHAELEKIQRFFVHSKRDVPLFIPDVEYGFAGPIVGILRKINPDVAIHRFNSDSLVYSFEKEKTADYVGAAVKAIARLNTEIDYKFQPK
jgi:orotidine-5'-phosphate decarboxylase